MTVADNTMLVDKLRPRNLDEMIGNTQIKKVIGGQINSRKFSHTYLFVGEAGTGKTTIARIISDELEAEYTEVNCATDGGIDNVRDIISDLPLGSLSSVSGLKVVVFDEAHTLTQPAQKALLKIAEEPPSHVYLMFCTNHPDKLDTALRTRCMTLSTEDLDKVSGDEKQKALEAAFSKLPEVEFENQKDLRIIGENSGNSLRAFYNNLDKLVTAGESRGDKVYISSALVKELFGGTQAEKEKRTKNIAQAFVMRNLPDMMMYMKELEKDKVPAHTTMMGVYAYCKAIQLKRANEGKSLDYDLAAFCQELSEYLGKFDLNWMLVESFAWKRWVDGQK